MSPSIIREGRPKAYHHTLESRVELSVTGPALGSQLSKLTIAQTQINANMLRPYEI